jgi:ABC-2 type transport system permease protein
MHPSRSVAIALRHFFLVRGSVSRLLTPFLWVLIDIVLWGFITKYLNTLASPGFNFVPALLGAVLIWDFFVRVMNGVTAVFFEDVWSRNFLNLFATPMSIPEYALGLVLSSLGLSLAALLAMLALAAAFGFSFLAYGAALLPFLLILFLFGIALGLLGCALVLRWGPSAEWFIWPIPAVLAPFAGVFYPLSTLPPWMQGIASAMPPAYVFEGMRSILAHQTLSAAGLIWSALLACAYIILGMWVLTRVYRRAVRTGLIARYSAETAF